MAKLSFADLKDEYTSLLNTMVVGTTDRQVQVLKDAVKAIKKNLDKYREVTKRTGVPDVVVGTIHLMEASCDLERHLHNGDPLTDRTVHKPSGRPPTGSPPFDWVESAVDALTMPNHFLDQVKDWPIERVAYELEKYNGFGYRLQDTGVNTPYLWSFTKHYKKGKFTDDGVFNPNSISRQPGAMAVLKALAEAGLKIEGSSGGIGGGTGGGGGGDEDGTSTAKTKPLQTDLFLPSGPFELHATATSPPADDPVVVEEDQPCLKLEEVGLMWKIEVQSDPKQTGFARGGIFKPLIPDPVVDIDAFAQLCLNAARFHGTSAHHLVAFADTETGIHNVAAVQGDEVGPFLLTAEDWNALIADQTTGFNARGRFNPLAQPFVAAKAAAADAKVLQPVLPNRLPTSAELYLAHLVGANHAVNILSGNQSTPIKDAITAEVGAPAFAILSDVRPWLFGRSLDVKSALIKIARRMDFGYDRADALFKRVEPDFDPGTSSGFAGRLCQTATKEWDFFGDNTFNIDGATTKAGHREGEPGFFERVGTYWRVVGDLSSDGRTSKPWSAAFISFCVKGSGAANKFHESPRHSVYVSQAIRDFNDKADVAYWCQRLTDHKPKPGDIICWAREEGVDYDHQKGGDYDGHCDLVVEVAANQIKVIGGNVGNSVTKRTFALDANGFVKGGRFQGELLFAIMENRLP
jgi:lysozyme family protein